jgi:hypothetical protein
MESGKVGGRYLGFGNVGSGVGTPNLIPQSPIPNLQHKEKK